MRNTAFLISSFLIPGICAASGAMNGFGLGDGPMGGGPVTEVKIESGISFVANLSVSDGHGHFCFIPVDLIEQSGLSVAEVMQWLNPATPPSGYTVMCDNTGETVPGGAYHYSKNFQFFSSKAGG